MAMYNITHVNGDLAVVYPNGTLYYAGGNHANCTVAACPIELSVYGYRPSLAASGTLIALYGICLLIQLALGIKYRTWWFMGAMITGCIVEILGYVGRILYWQEPWTGPGFIMQIVLITIGPVFFAAAIYVLLGKIFQYLNIKTSRIPIKWYTWLFLTCDIISLILQAVGGAMSSTSNGSSTAGVNIALAGLSFQVATLVVFAILAVDAFVRGRATLRQAQLPTRFIIFGVSLALATLLILIRCVYRIYELSEGYTRDSAALRDQPLFIGLESVMVIVAAYALIVAHPGGVFRERQPTVTTDDREKTGV